jgi:hypothetical protein
MAVSNKHAIAETYLECAKIAREFSDDHPSARIAIRTLAAQFEERAIKTREGIPLD